EEADDGPDDRGRDDRKLERAGHVIALTLVGGRKDAEARLLVLPEADDHVRADREDRGTAGKTIETIGEVDRVRHRGRDEDDPHCDDHEAEAGAEQGDEVESRNVSHERYGRGRRRLSVGVAVGERDHGEDDRDDGAADDLVRAAQPEAVPATHLEEIVDESDRSEADHHQDDEERRYRGLFAGDNLAEEVTDHRRGDEDDTTHRGRSTLDHVSRRGVGANELPEIEPSEGPREQRRQQQREDHGGRGGDEERDHASTPPSRSPRNLRPADFEDFTSTTSPSRNSSRRRSYASSASPTSTDSPSHEPSRPAALWMCRAP